MRKLSIIFLILLFAISANAATTVSGRPCPGGAAIANECGSTLVCQNFEGTGYDNSESWTESCTSATCDEDYATSPAPLRGSQSLLMDAGDGASSTYVAFTAQDEISGHFMIRVGADTGGTLMSIKNGTTTLFYIGYNSGGNKYIANAATLGATGFTVPETHYVWFHYKKGTGADEINKWWYSTTRTFPGNGSEDISISDGASTAQADRIYLQDSIGGPTAIFDQLIVKAGTAGLENITE